MVCSQQTPVKEQQQNAQHISRRPQSAAAVTSTHAMTTERNFNHLEDDQEQVQAEAEALLAEGPELALLVLSRQNWARRLAARLVTNKCFEWLILALILANCVTLAMYSHQPGFDATQLGQALGYADYVFAACFSLEFLLKVVAMGLVMQPGTYLRNGWNMLDAAVVALGWLDIALSGDQYTFLRTVRVLRPLRTITHIKGLKVPVATLARALPMLLDVLVLCLFAFFIFGVVAVQLFAGVLRNRCAAADLTHAYLVPAADGGQQIYANVSYLQPADGSIQQCSGYLAAEVTWQSLQQGSGAATWPGGSGGRGAGWSCPTQPQLPDAPLGMFCAQFGNPNNGMTSFDTIVWAWVTIFQCITTEGWTDIMYALQDALSPWVLVYFVLLIVFGSFFLVNLALAVLYLQFTKEFSVSPAASRAASAAVSRCGSFAGGRLRVQLPVGTQVQEHVQRRRKSTVSGDVPGCGDEQQQQQQQCQGEISLPQHQQSFEELLEAHQQPLAPTSGVTWSSLTAENCGTVAAAVQSMPECLSEHGFVTAKVIVSRRTISSKAIQQGEGKEQQSPALPSDSKLTQQQSPRTILKTGVHVHVQQQVPKQRQKELEEQLQQQQQPHTLLRKCQALLRWCVWPFSTVWELLQRKCRELIKTGWLEIVSLVVIVTNTAVMASASYPGNPQWQAASDILNVAFCCYFALELLVKLLGVGLKAFVRDRMNQFDALVVAASLVEVVMFLLPGDETSSNSLSVLRTARLLRVFKLARSWSELNRIITTILRSFSQVVYLSLLLMLFVFIFALMGMQLFGFKFASCSVPGSQQLPPPGLPPSAYPDCYIPCQEQQALSWIDAKGSPYNDMAFCEQFPRDSSSGGGANASGVAAADPSSSFQYWAQVGKAVVPDSRFDNIGWAAITVFQIITTENWNAVAYTAMAATSQAAYLWFVVVIVLGNYILLNLFLAILLENFGSSSANNLGGASSKNSAGGTLAAAAKTAQLLAWMQELVESSWFARMVQRRNRVAALQGPGEDEVDSAAATLQEATGQHNLQEQPRASVGFLEDTPRSCGSGDAATRGPAHLLGDASESDGSPWLQAAPGHKASIMGGCQTLSPAKRSFSPLVAPSQGLQSLSVRQGSFLCPRTHSVMGRSQAGVTAAAAVMRSAQSCYYTTTASWAGGNSGRESSLDRACLTSSAAAAAAAQESMHIGLGSSSSGISHARMHASASGHRLASMGHGGQEALCVLQAQQQHPSVTGADEKELQPSTQDASDDQLPGTVQAAAEGMQQHGPTFLLDAGLKSPPSCPDTAGLTSAPGGGCAPALPPKGPLSGYSCCLLSPSHWLRVCLNKLLDSPYFEKVILVLIFASSIALALDMPSLDPTGSFKKALEALDCIFAVLFLIEAIIKILVQGFVFNGAGSYLRNPWNALDFVIVVIGVIVMGTTLSGLHRQQSLSSLKALRTLRALRPLRVASRLAGMKVVVNSLFASLPALGNVLLVCLLVYLIFGIMAVDLLGGALYGCQDSSGQLYDSDYVLPAGQHITRDWCLNSSLQVKWSAYHDSINVTIPPYTPQREWGKLPVANFDNILLATFTLWQISTTELWVNVMYTAISAVGVDQQPQAGYNPALALFFIAFIVFGGFFVLQLFVSVTIEKFSEMHEQQGKSALLTQQQEGWLRIERMMADIDLQVKHKPPRQCWRAAIFHVVQSRQAEIVVMAAIIANCLVMAMTHADMDTSWEDFMTWANLGFTAFFTVEILAKVVALGIKPVLRDTWCRFDIIIVLVSIIGVAVDLGTPSNLQFLPLLRVLRVVRIFRLIPKAEGLRVLLRTLFMSLPALGNIVSVLGLFFFIYSVIGMTLWGSIKYGQYLNRQANFQHMGMALLTLFRMITGESWDGIMQDCMLTSMCVEVLQAVDDPGDGTGSITTGTWLDPGDERLSRISTDAVANRCSPSPVAAVVYFCSFVLLCGLVLVNFVIGVIIDNFQSSCESDDLPISKASVDHFAQVWSELDPQATHFIPAIQLSTLIQELLPPLGAKGEEGARTKVQAIIMAADIPVRNGKVHFLETMHALAGRIAGTEVPDDEEQKVRRMLYPRLPSKDASDVPKYGVSYFYAALYVQAAVRGFLRRHALKEGCSTHSSLTGAAASAEQQGRRRSSQCQWLLAAPENALSQSAAAGGGMHHQQQEAVQLGGGTMNHRQQGSQPVQGARTQPSPLGPH